MDWQPLILSAQLACLTTVLLVGLAAPLAYFLAYFRFAGKSFLEALINLPLAMPPTVLGFYLLVVLGPKGFIGHTWEVLTGSYLVFTFLGIIIASLIYSLPFAIQPMKTAFEKIDRRLLESASVLGLSPLAAFFKVVIPNSVSGICASAILVFVHTMGEFGVILMIGGSIPGKTRVASIAIYEAVESLNYRAAGWMSLVLLLISYAFLLLINHLNRSKTHGA